MSQPPALEHDCEPPFGYEPARLTRRCGSGTGSGRSSIWLKSEKIAAFAPIPSASDSTATAVTNGVLKSVRSATLRLAMTVGWRLQLGQGAEAKSLLPSLPRRPSSMAL